MNYCNGTMYAIRQGDTLYAISKKYGVPLALLLRANPYVDVYNLQVGETICVPMRGERDGNMANNMGTGQQPVMQQPAMQQPVMQQPAMQQPVMQQPAMEQPAMQQSTGQPEMEQQVTGQQETAQQTGRYVTKPGDTLMDVLQCEDSGALTDFVNSNGMDKILLLPGVAYRCKNR